jgi:hypothetical protein
MDGSASIRIHVCIHVHTVHGAAQAAFSREKSRRAEKEASGASPLVFSAHRANVSEMDNQ